MSAFSIYVLHEFEISAFSINRIQDIKINVLSIMGCSI